MPVFARGYKSSLIYFGHLVTVYVGTIVDPLTKVGLSSSINLFEAGYSGIKKVKR